MQVKVFQHQMNVINICLERCKGIKTTIPSPLDIYCLVGAGAVLNTQNPRQTGDALRETKEEKRIKRRGFEGL